LDLHESGYHSKGLEKGINRYRFLIFDLDYLIRVQSSEPIHAKNESNLLLAWIAVIGFSSL
jgi:hypothetical protein